MTLFRILMLCLLSLPMRGQQAESLIELPDVDTAILVTELMQTDSMAEARLMVQELGFVEQVEVGREVVFSYLRPGCVVVLRLQQQADGPRLRRASFSAPAVERLLPEVMLRLGYRAVEQHDNSTVYQNDRLHIRAVLDYDPVWHTSSMTFWADTPQR